MATPSTKVKVGPFIKKFFSLFLFLLVHLGCFLLFSSSSADTNHLKPPNSRKRRLLAAASSSAAASRFKANRALSSSWAYVKRAFTNSKISAVQSPTTAHTSARSSHRSLVSMVQPETADVGLDSGHTLLPQQLECSDIASDINHNPLFLPLRNDIFPCTTCGEIFPNPQLFEQHLSVKHAVSKLIGDDSGRNILNIIFRTGWTNREQTPKIHRVLKIHNSQKIMARFEDYREVVKSKAARHGAATAGSRRPRDERCIADGNELLRFHCSTFMCDLGQDGGSATCNLQQYCSVCGIIRSGFSPKLDGISTLSTSWRAHLAIPEDTLEEFSRHMNVNRAMLICRVGCDQLEEEEKGDGGFDSVVGRPGGSGAGQLNRLDEEELLVFNPRAVLPCFVIVYTV